jgi:hypothetical protein
MEVLTRAVYLRDKGRVGKTPSEVYTYECITEKEETIMKKNKITISIWGCIGVFLITVLMLLPATQTKAETMKYKYTTHDTKVETVILPDVEGHVVGVWERRGIVFFENEVAAIVGVGTFEKIKSVTTFQGYTTLTFEDGSTFTQNVQGSHSPLPGENLDTYKDCNGNFLKGTGRFEGIKGKLSFTGRQITPYTKDKTKGDNWIEVTATYTLPKKNE